jgi:hypothetical protein
VWWDQDCLNEFRASPDYTVFLVFLGMLDLSQPQGASSSFRAIQTVKFLGINACNGLYLRGWLSFFTVTLAHPVTDAQRQMFRRLQGPRYPRAKDGDTEMKLKLMKLPVSTQFPGLQHGWVQELRELAEEGKDKATVAQDCVFYKMWLSKEAEDRRKSAIPGVKLGWDDELREIGARDTKEEHVDLVYITRGRSHKS